MRKVFQKSFKKVLAIFLTLVLLFNAGGESFATIFDKQFVGQEKIISEIREVLQNAKIEDDPETKDYQACVDNKNEEKCTAYVTGIKEQFKQSAKQSQNPTTEDKKSYKTFEAAYKKAIEKEYKKAEEEIDKDILSGWLFNELTWENMNNLNYLEKKNKEDLLNWKKAEEGKIKSKYAQYEKEYEEWEAKVKKEQEEAGRKYLQEVSKRLIKTYNATKSNSLKREIRKLIVALLSSEGEVGNFVEWRLSSESILIDGLAGKPCDFKVGGKKLTQEAADRYIGYDKPGVYPEIKSEDWIIIPAEYKDEARCNEAFIALDGLSYLDRSDNGIKAVRTFMRENHQGLAAADSLIEGMAILLKWKAYNNINEYIAGEMISENEGRRSGFGGFGAISEDLAYNGNYLGLVSAFAQRPNGTNAWEDLAKLLAEEGSKESQNILRSSINSCKISHVIIGSDQLNCTTILPFLYGALLYAPKVMDTAKPYQEPIPAGNDYLDAAGNIHPINRERIIANNRWLMNDFKDKLSTYGNTLSKGLAGFLYYLKFADLPVKTKMQLDNKLAAVYTNLSPYGVGSKRYKKLQAGRAVVSVFKVLGVIFDIWCFVSLIGMGFKALTGTQALIKARKILSGASALTTMQRANILRQITFIREGAALRRFGRNTMKFIVNSENIGRKINVSAYLAKKNGMSTINYMLHNIAYGKAKSAAIAGNVLRVEGVASSQFFKSSHYIPEIHGNIFRISRDINRAGKIGIREMGKGGTIISYISEADMPVYMQYTEDFIKGAETGEKVRERTQTLMSGRTELLSRDLLYKSRYKKILPYVQDRDFVNYFKKSRLVYDYFKSNNLYVVNAQTDKILTDLTFHLNGYLRKNNFLRGLIVIDVDVAKTAEYGTKAAEYGTKAEEAFGSGTNFTNALTLSDNKLFLHNWNPIYPTEGVVNFSAITRPLSSQVGTAVLGGRNVFESANARGVGFKLSLDSPQKLGYRNVVGKGLENHPQSNLATQSRTGGINNPFKEDLIPLSNDPFVRDVNILSKYTEEDIVKDIDNILKQPLSLEKKFKLVYISDKLKKHILTNLSEGLAKVRAETQLTVKQEQALDGILKEITAFINERRLCKASELFDKLNKFYTNLEWARAEKPTLLVDGLARTNGFFGGVSEEGVTLKDASYNESDFYDKLAFYVKQMSQEHDEFNIYLNMHGGFEGRILIINDMETNIPTLLAKIKESAGTSKVNIVTFSCHGQSAGDFTGQVVNYGFNYLGISSINNATYSPTNKINTMLGNESMPQIFLNAVSSGYLGSVLVYEGKVYRSLDIAKAYYKDNPAMLAQLDLLQELFFGEDPIKVMIELGKQEGYSLRLFNSTEEAAGTIANVNRNLTPEEIKKIVENNTLDYNLRHIISNIKYFINYGKFRFDIIDHLGNEIPATGYPYMLKFLDGKVLTLSGPTSVTKYKILKPIEELFKTEGISFSNPAKIKLELKSGNLGKESLGVLEPLSINKIESPKPVKVDYSYEGTIKNINNILEKPMSSKKNTVVFSLDSNKKEKIFDVLAGKISNITSENTLNETQKTALDNILDNAVSAINERTVFMSEDLLDIINKFYANAEWISNEKPILTVDAYEAKDSFLGWFSPNGVSVKAIPYNKEDFYSKFDTTIRTLAQNHKEFNMILRFHGSSNGKIQLTDKLESNIPTILARIKENAGASKVNIITTACFAQAMGDFTEQIIKYGFNYIGFSAANSIAFSGLLFNRIAPTITDFPQTFLNAIAVGYLGSVLVYEGKVYRALDIAKAYYKDNAAISTQIKYLQELFFGKNPIDAMMKLGKQDGYTLTLFNSEKELESFKGLETFENIGNFEENSLTYEEIKRQVNRDRIKYNVEKFTEAFFTDRLLLPNGGIWLPRFFKTLNNDIQTGGHQFLIGFKNGKFLGLSGPTAKIKYDILKGVQETFRNEGIPFSKPADVIKESKKSTAK